MHDVSRKGLRLAGLLAMAVCISHCGDSSVHIRTGNGTNPTPGSFAGFTDQGGVITIQVGSIEAVAFDCDGHPISATFSPPREVNGDGTFDVQFSDAGRKFHVSGRFTSNDDAEGIVDDADNQCDTGFQASRGTPSSSPTKTPKPGETKTPTPSGPTHTPTGETTAVTITPTPSGGDTNGPTPTVTPTGTAATCPTLISFTGTSTTGVLDSGWTGFGHDASVVSNGTVTVSVTTCAGTAPACGVCSYTGPVENTLGTNQVQSHRCSLDSSTKCTSDANCSGKGTCKFFFGSYLPLVAGGVSTCVENTFASAVTGTANVNTGTAAGTALDTARVFSGIVLSNPCPRCLNDPTQNDGNQGGTCSGGARDGMPCDASGSSPNVSLGTTSLDCPPPPGAVIASLPIDLANTTGTKVRTLSASSPNCRATGFTTNKCQCDTCNNLAATPCSSNADCGGSGICGGKRCVGGTNAGTPCSANSECPGAGASCSTPGQATAPNACDPGAVCIADAGTPSPNDRVCDLGPFNQFCAPTETFRGCTVDGDCSFAGDTCSGGKLRDCFDNGTIGVGDAVTASGAVSVPSGHQSNPTLAALFCVGPTSSGSVNAAAGLPGLGRLELKGHSVDNGTP